MLGDRKGRSEHPQRVKLSEDGDAEIDRKGVISGGFLAKSRSKMARFWPEQAEKRPNFSRGRGNWGVREGFSVQTLTLCPCRRPPGDHPQRQWKGETVANASPRHRFCVMGTFFSRRHTSLASRSETSAAKRSMKVLAYWPTSNCPFTTSGVRSMPKLSEVDSSTPCEAK